VCIYFFFLVRYRKALPVVFKLSADCVRLPSRMRRHNSKARVYSVPRPEHLDRRVHIASPLNSDVVQDSRPGVQPCHELGRVCGRLRAFFAGHVTCVQIALKQSSSDSDNKTLEVTNCRPKSTMSCREHGSSPSFGCLGSVAAAALADDRLT
jgi:hypothetical protein